MTKTKSRADKTGDAREPRRRTDPVPHAVPKGRERARAAAYLDLWERHVSHAAVHGQGISAPWFAR